MNDSEIITSRDNAKLKLARSVRDGREAGLVFIEGIRLAFEALRSHLPITTALVSADFAADTRYRHLVDLLDRTRVEPLMVAEKAFASIADTESSQGIVLLGEMPAASLDMIGPDGGPVVLLHRVNNPSNLGAVVRTAEASGATGLITTTGSAAAFSPKALRASMGSAFRLPVVERISFGDAISWAKRMGLVTTAAEISGSLSYSEIDWEPRRLIAFGSEAHGFDRNELSAIDQTVRIPLENEVESLNLAVSAGIILFEAKRRREK